MISLDYASPAELRLLAKFVADLADLRQNGVDAGKKLQEEIQTEARIEKAENIANAAVAAAKSAAASITLEELRALAKANRNKAVALVAEFGVKQLSELKPEQYAEFKSKLEAA